MSIRMCAVGVWNYKRGNPDGRVVIWMRVGQGKWRPTAAMTLKDAYEMVKQLERDGVQYRVAEAPKFEPEEEGDE